MCCVALSEIFVTVMLPNTKNEACYAKSGIAEKIFEIDKEIDRA